MHIEYYKDGTPCKCDEIRREYFHNSDDLLSEVPIVHSKIHGIKRVYCYSGILHGIVPYKNGLRQGTQKVYYESGALESEVPYVNDNAHGLEKSYKESGVLCSEQMRINRIYYPKRRCPMENFV